MRLVFFVTLLWSLNAHAGFGGSYSRGGGGGGSRTYSAPSRSYSAPSRSYSAPSRSYSYGSRFGGSYSRPTPTPKQAPIVRPSMPEAPARPSYSRPAPEPSYPSHRTTVEHHHYGSSGGSGFFSGYLWGSLLSQPRHTTTYVQGAPANDGGYYGNQAPVVPVERHYGFWSFVGDFLLVALVAVIIFFFIGVFFT